MIAWQCPYISPVVLSWVVKKNSTLLMMVFNSTKIQYSFVRARPSITPYFQSTSRDQCILSVFLPSRGQFRLCIRLASVLLRPF